MKATTRTNGHAKTHHFNLAKDYRKIKTALTGAQRDMRKHAQRFMSDSIENIKDRSIEAQDLLSDYIAEKPFKTVGIVAICGFILGFLFRK